MGCYCNGAVTAKAGVFVGGVDFSVFAIKCGHLLQKSNNRPTKEK